jgi:hypothetical protein
VVLKPPATRGGGPGCRRRRSTARSVSERNGRVFYEAKWCDSRGRQVKRRVGPAWVERDGAGCWRRRGGRVPDGWFDEKAAIVEMRRLIDAREDQPRRRAGARRGDL